MPRICLPFLVGLVLLRSAGPARAQSAWTWPVEPPHRVVRGFDPPAHDWLPGHRGVDLAAPVGATVRSAGAGTVSFAGAIAGVGVVAVRHAGGLETTYQPVRAVVRRGDAVATGQRLGVVGRDGHCAPEACLHWGLRRGDVYLDPLGLVGAARVRLLPVLDGGVPPWLPPAAGGASAGSGLASLLWVAHRRRARRRPLPPGVACLTAARDLRRGDGRRSGHAGRADDG